MPKLKTGIAMDSSETLKQKHQVGNVNEKGQKNIRNPKKVTDNFSLDEEPLRKLKNYVLSEKMKGNKISASSVINELIKNKVSKLNL